MECVGAGGSRANAARGSGLYSGGPPDAPRQTVRYGPAHAARAAHGPVPVPALATGQRRAQARLIAHSARRCVHGSGSESARAAATVRCRRETCLGPAPASSQPCRRLGPCASCLAESGQGPRTCSARPPAAVPSAVVTCAPAPFWFRDRELAFHSLRSRTCCSDGRGLHSVPHSMRPAPVTSAAPLPLCCWAAGLGAPSRAARRVNERGGGGGRDWIDAGASPLPAPPMPPLPPRAVRRAGLRRGPSRGAPALLSLSLSPSVLSSSSPSIASAAHAVPACVLAHHVQGASRAAVRATRGEIRFGSASPDRFPAP